MFFKIIMIAHIGTVGLIICDNFFGKFHSISSQRTCNSKDKSKSPHVLIHQPSNSLIMTAATLPTMGEVLNSGSLVFTKGLT
jgi:hypothetical protein